MSLLVRSYYLNTCRRCVTNLSQIIYFRLSPSSNLNTEFSFNVCKSLSTDVNLNTSVETVKRYLDYLANVYQAKYTTKDEAVKEIISLTPVTDLLDRKIEIMKCIESLKDLVSDDKEMKNLIKEEKLTYNQQLENIDEKLLDTILQNVIDENYENIIMEIIPGVGGHEAMLFVKDLYNMYIGYFDYLGLEYEAIDIDYTEQGGCRNITIHLSGNRAFEKLMFESGVHRVQRVPTTEKSGRIHTSTASVAILPEPTDIQVTLNAKDLKIEAKRASGAGGQHVNTTDSAIRIVHIPTGIAVTCQMNKSQAKNREWALTKLKSILYDQQLEKQLSSTTNLRKKQIGRKYRNEKIRTYNYPQNRITDHRISGGTMHNIQEFMEGGAGLEELENRLQKEMQKKILLEIIQKSESQLK